MLSVETVRDGLSNSTVQWTLAVVLPFTFYRLYLTLWRPAFLSKAPVAIPEDVPVIGATRFWSARWKFFKEWRAKKSSFGFYVGNNQVIGVTGTAARQDFFNSRELSFDKGSVYRALSSGRNRADNEINCSYKLLTGSEAPASDGGHDFSKHFTGTLTRMLKGGEFIRSKLTRLPT